VAAAVKTNPKNTGSFKNPQIYKNNKNETRLLTYLHGSESFNLKVYFSNIPHMPYNDPPHDF
jgi:hypothetical protein